MADTSTKTAEGHEHEEDRRDFLLTSTIVVGAAGVALAAWPFIDFMNPSADVLALASLEFDLSSMEPGQAVTVTWRNKPVFIRRRTAAEIDEAKKVPLSDLKDPQADADRVKEGKDEWLVMIGICTHLGCIPAGQKVTDSKGEFGGWFCPCHGSHYDTSGRIRKGPAPRNLEIPPYAFTNDTTVRIG